jgi:hypothetical protein
MAALTLARPRLDQADARTMTPRIKRKLPVNPASARYRLARARSMSISADSTVVTDGQVHHSCGSALAPWSVQLSLSSSCSATAGACGRGA